MYKYIDKWLEAVKIILKLLNWQGMMVMTLFVLLSLGGASGFSFMWAICVAIFPVYLTDWGWVTHIWTNAGILLIGPLGTNFSEISIGIQTFSVTKMHLKMSSAKWRPISLYLSVLTQYGWNKITAILKIPFKKKKFLLWKLLYF